MLYYHHKQNQELVLHWEGNTLMQFLSHWLELLYLTWLIRHTPVYRIPQQSSNDEDADDDGL
jgi:hypothetical protein